jgi:hypothetical protein
MASVIHDLATYLQSYSPSLSLTIGTNLFRFDLTPTPDAQVALIPYQGMEGEGGFGREGVRWEYPRVQVVCRGAKDDKATPYATALAVKAALAKIEVETLSGTFYHGVRVTDPTNLGTDANGRYSFAFNAHVDRDLGA